MNSRINLLAVTTSAALHSPHVRLSNLACSVSTLPNCMSAHAAAVLPLPQVACAALSVLFACSVVSTQAAGDNVSHTNRQQLLSGKQHMVLIHDTGWHDLKSDSNMA